MRLDNADGVKLLLEEYHAIKERRYIGDVDACAIIEDLHTAITAAKLTPNQAEAVRLVFFEDLTQVEAGLIMGKTRQKVNRALQASLLKIARVYEGWAHQGIGYSVEEVEAYAV